MQFPSGEIQVTLDTAPHAARIYPVTITGSILSSDHVMELLLLVEAITLLPLYLKYILATNW